METEMNESGIRTYKISVYHRSSNIAERVVKGAGLIIRTYCHDNQRQWSYYTEKTEEFIKFANYDPTGITPYEAMFRRRPPRVIGEIVGFDWFNRPQRDNVQIIEARIK